MTFFNEFLANWISYQTALHLQPPLLNKIHHADGIWFCPNFMPQNHVCCWIVTGLFNMSMILKLFFYSLPVLKIEQHYIYMLFLIVASCYAVHLSLWTGLQKHECQTSKVWPIVCDTFKILHISLIDIDWIRNLTLKFYCLIE